mmetsp:Transcript_14698/g.15888  ORF Transcript_14698/g.15888 Transcript_14698/m.15888 type:complete len:99 (-) Transcript_14698:68-364(-)
MEQSITNTWVRKVQKDAVSTTNQKPSAKVTPKKVIPTLRRPRKRQKEKKRKSKTISDSTLKPMSIYIYSLLSVTTMSYELSFSLFYNVHSKEKKKYIK